MSQSVYYHNLTKGWFNENDYGDAVEKSDVGDIIKFSIRGSALIFDLQKEDSTIEYSGEYEYARDKFLDYFKKYHGKQFIKNK